MAFYKATYDEDKSLKSIEIFSCFSKRTYFRKFNSVAYYCVLLLLKKKKNDSLDFLRRAKKIFSHSQSLVYNNN